MPENTEPIYFPPQHKDLYPTFADLAQVLGYLGFARDLDVTNATYAPGVFINECVVVNAWVYKLCIAYKQWDGTWFQRGSAITSHDHKKRILKDAILQVSQAVAVNQKL